MEALRVNDARRAYRAGGVSRSMSRYFMACTKARSMMLSLAAASMARRLLSRSSSFMRLRSCSRIWSWRRRWAKIAITTAVFRQHMFSWLIFLRSTTPRRSRSNLVWFADRNQDNRSTVFGACAAGHSASPDGVNTHPKWPMLSFRPTAGLTPKDAGGCMPNDCNVPMVGNQSDGRELSMIASSLCIALSASRSLSSPRWSRRLSHQECVR
mmetsp:Transcript_28770/g.81153  ORF Transcript_28770/g.81153 Transcript_28770/m.81153 type:complete len:211 (-) Transcript_28770:1104-1736(-)